MNLANILTISRFCMVPLVIVMIVQGQWRVLVFVLAGLTDAVDGYVAKRFDQRTELGAYLDPLADKALLISIYVTLSILGVIPAWLAILVVSRDIMIVGAVILSWVLGNPVEIRPLFVSKANTSAQIGLAALVLGLNAFAIDGGRGVEVLSLAVGVLTGVSAGAYLALWLRHMAG